MTDESDKRVDRLIKKLEYADEAFHAALDFLDEKTETARRRVKYAIIALREYEWGDVVKDIKEVLGKEYDDDENGN